MREHDMDRDPPSADLLAAEYVLGVLDSGQRRDAKLRMTREPAFARLVDDWARRVEPLNDELAPVEAPAHIWLRIRTQLGWSPMERTDDRVHRRLAFWRTSAAAGFATAAALAIVMLTRPQQAPTPVAPPVATRPATPTRPAPMLELPVTQLVSDKGQLTFLATVDTRSGGLWLVPVPGSVKGGERVPVLWLIPSGEQPRALGFVGASHSHWVDVPADLRKAIAAGSVLAVTMEPAREPLPQAPSAAPMAVGDLSL